MARGKEGKLRRRQNRQSEREGDDAARQFLDDATADDEDTPSVPLRRKEKVVVETVDSDDDDENNDSSNVPMPKKTSKSKSASSSNANQQQQLPVKAKKEGIKRTPLILLCCLLGTTLLPVLIYASDYLASHNVLGQVGFRLGIGAVPKRRVTSFYEKHAPEKLHTVPTILASNYGKYSDLTKKLERKYQDYGYFIGWEQDEAPITKALEGMHAAYQVWMTDYWNRYAPQPVKTAMRNVRYNLTFLYKKGRKVWKKQVWPMLEPIFGVPKGTEKQKRQDAADARARQKGSSSSSGKKTRRRSQEFRDDED